MRRKKNNHLTLFLVLLLLNCIITKAQTVRIMPMGNSITFDVRSGDTRPDEERISYRYALYQLLTANGYDFDFVGSENSGSNYLGNDYDDNAGFPGISDDQLAYLINTGYNQSHDIWEAPGPYFIYYPADIILLHIGTNYLTTDPGDVEDILNYIRFYDSEVYILVARIINRNPYHYETTVFNDNVEAMVNARGDSRIIMVNQETGAGINYSTEMYDYLHPTQAGYDKMAYPWFYAIQNLNQPPVISDIPEQFTDEGTAFENISLDDYVTDAEDPDYILQWTYTQESGSNLNVSIDGSRILQVSPANSDWYGTETLWLKVTDTGSRAFKKSDSIEVTFTVEPINDPPVIDDQNPISMIENTSYEITFSDLIVEDVDNPPAELSIEVSAGANYTYNNQTITPTPDYNGNLNVNIQVCDPYDCSNLFSLLINVLNINDPPVIVSDPVINGDDYEEYSYTIEAIDTNAQDVLTYFINEKPTWSDFNASTHTLSGIPEWNDANNFFDVSIGVTDGRDTVYQEYNIYVSDNDDPPEFTSEPEILAFINKTYTYEITFFDIDEDDEVILSIITFPDWLTYIEETHTLIGIPTEENLNQEFPVVLELTDGKRTVFQTFTITVQKANDITTYLLGSQPLNIYPNPSDNYIHIEFELLTEESKIELFDLQGNLIKTTKVREGEHNCVIDVSDLMPGLYLVVIGNSNKKITGIFLAK